MLKIALRELWRIKTKKGTSGKKGQPGKKAQHIPIFSVVTYEEEYKDEYHSVWENPEPHPKVLEVLSQSGFGGLGLLISFLASAGFKPHEPEKSSIQVYSPGDMNRLIKSSNKGT